MTPTKALFFLFLITTSGCGKAEISNVRKDYILGKDHSWIELAVDIPTQRVDPVKAPSNCRIEIALNGETYLQEQLYPRADSAIKTGFLFAVPSEQSVISIKYLSCQKMDTNVSSSTVLVKDNLYKLLFDGQTIGSSAPVPYVPVTIAGLDEKMRNLETARQADQALLKADASLLLRLLTGLIITVGIGLIAFVVYNFRRKKYSE